MKVKQKVSTLNRHMVQLYNSLEHILEQCILENKRDIRGLIERKMNDWLLLYQQPWGSLWCDFELLRQTGL